MSSAVLPSYLSFYNETSSDFYLQVARSLLIREVDAVATLSPSVTSPKNNTSRATIKVESFIYAQTAFSTPSDCNDRLSLPLRHDVELRVTVPPREGDDETTTRQQSSSPQVVQLNFPAESLHTAQCFTYSHDERALVQDSFGPFLSPLCIGLSNSSPSESITIEFSQAGHVVSRIQIPPAANASTPTYYSIEIAQDVYYRLSPFHSNLSSPIPSSSSDSQPQLQQQQQRFPPTAWMEKHDWRSISVPSDSQKEKRITVRMVEGDMQYIEEQLVLDAASSSNANDHNDEANVVHPLIVTGDAELPSTQLVLLGLLEKEMKSFHFKWIHTDKLALNHPLRCCSLLHSNTPLPSDTRNASLQAAIKGRIRPQHLLPFVNQQAKSSAMDGTQQHGWDAILHSFESSVRTGSRLWPLADKEKAQAAHLLELIHYAIQPRVEILLDEYIFGVAQGHQPKQIFVAESLAELPAFLDQIESNLSQQYSTASKVSFLVNGKFSLVDLALLPHLALLLQTPAAPLVADRPFLAALLVKLQQRPSWKALQNFLSKNQAELQRKFVDSPAGEAFNA